MAEKPKAGASKKPPRKKMTQAEQSERFIKTARELGVDETGEEFERAFDKIVRPTEREPSTKDYQHGRVPKFRRLSQSKSKVEED